MPDGLAGLPAQYIRNILDAMPAGIFISDASGRTLYVNRVYEQLTNLRQEDLHGKNVRHLVREGMFDHVLNPEIVRTGQPATRVQRLRNGTRLVLSGFPVFDKDGVLRLVATFVRDVTLLTNLQEQVTAQHQLIDQISGQLTNITREQPPQGAPVHASPVMQDILALLGHFAATDATVLILGETGVGKEVIGRYLHSISDRKDKVMLKVDCGGIAESLMESELFGYLPGAFTGASAKGRAGYFEIAEGGAIFLDEVAELSLPMQTRLLRVLQDNEVVRVGATSPRKVNVRVIAATNQDLARRVEEGSFRRDLYYRLNVASLHIPPLRERRADVRPLAEHFLRLYSAKYRKTLAFMNVTLDILAEYDWPGNVRELQNLVHSLVITRHGPLIGPGELPEQFHSREKSPDALVINAESRSLKEIMADMERDFLRKAIEAHGSVQKVAELFQVNRSTIFRKLQGQATPDQC